MPDSGVNVFKPSLKSSPYPFKEEGKSRITPFQAMYLVELWCSFPEKAGYQINSVYRREVCDTLMEAEYRNEDWSFGDYEKWITDRFSKFTRKDWRKYYRSVKKGEYV